MGFWSKLKGAIAAPFKVAKGLVSGIASVPKALVGAGGQAIRTVADVARGALPGLMQAAAQGLPAVGAAMGGPLGAALGQLGSGLLTRPATDTVQAVGQQALAHAQHLLGGTPVPPTQLVNQALYGQLTGPGWIGG